MFINVDQLHSNSIISIGGITTRADVAKDIMLLSNKTERLVKIPNVEEVLHYLKIQDESDNTDK